MTGSVQRSSEDLLFAVFAVQLGFATPAQVTRSAATAKRDPGVSMREHLIEDAHITADQREAIERQIDKELSDRFDTMDGSSPVEDSKEEKTAVSKGSKELADKTVVDAPPPLPARIDDQKQVTKEQTGRYSIRHVHGRGGQARVMLAFDEHIGRDVALKELLPEESRRDWSEPVPKHETSTPGVVRFLREARVTGQLEHPNIVPVHEVGIRQNGTFYYTMRFVRGQTLSFKLANCKNLNERLKFLGPFWDMCNAIAFAHSKGVVHRDIKPDNAMVGEFGETVLLDWGVAKVKNQPDSLASGSDSNADDPDAGRKTAAGTAIGTPSYMSPEQARGWVDEIDERSDVWGLGAVLYEILTGRPPYMGKTALEIIPKVGQEKIPQVLDLCPDAPPELVAIVEKALQREKANRYQGAKELAEEISSYMTGRRVAAYQYSAWELFKRFATQKKPIIIAAGLILLVIIGALVVVSFALTSESRALQNESQARKNEVAARSQEQQKQLVANYHLAQAYAEKADRLAEDNRFLSASIFAAASLKHNPVHPISPFHDANFKQKFPASIDLNVKGASAIYRSRFNHWLTLRRSFQTEEAMTQPAFSPDGKLLAVGSLDKTIRLWNPQTGESLPPIKGLKNEVYSVAISPDGKVLASCDRDGDILLSNLETRQQELIKGNGDQVRGLAFSDSGDILAAAGWDKTVHLWNIKKRVLENILAHPDKVNQVQFSPNGKLLATACDDKKIRMWSASSGKLLTTLRGHTDKAIALAFSPDGSRLASGGSDKAIWIWDVRKGKALQTMVGHLDGLLSLAYSTDGSVLASSSYDKTIRIWDGNDGRPMLTVEAHQNFIHGICFSKDGRMIASAGNDKMVRLWDVHLHRDLVSLKEHRDVVYGVDFSPNGSRLASSSWDKTAIIWSLKKNTLLHVLKGHTDKIDRVAFSPNGKIIATASRDHTVRLWSANTGRPLMGPLTGHTDFVYGLAFSPDGQWLATSSADKTVRLWEVKTGKAGRILSGHQEIVKRVAFSPNGRWLVSASYDKTIRIWDPQSGEMINKLNGHNDWISDVNFSPDGGKMVSAGKDKVAIVWDTGSWQPLLRLMGHNQWINSAKFSPDGKLIATASDDQSVRVWSADDGQFLLSINTTREAVAIAFNKESNKLAIGDGSDILLYPMDFSLLYDDPARLLQQSEQTAGSKLEGFQLEQSGL